MSLLELLHFRITSEGEGEIVYDLNGLDQDIIITTIVEGESGLEGKLEWFGEPEFLLIQ